MARPQNSIDLIKKHTKVLIKVIFMTPDIGQIGAYLWAIIP